MIDDLKKNWRTTLAGFIACGFAVWFLYKGEVSQASVTVVIGLGLISGKDGLNKSSNNS